MRLRSSRLAAPLVLTTAVVLLTGCTSERETVASAEPQVASSGAIATPPPPPPPSSQRSPAAQAPARTPPSLLLPPAVVFSTPAAPPADAPAAPTAEPPTVAGVALGAPVEGEGFTVAFPQGWEVAGDEATTPVPGGTARLAVASEPAESARVLAAGVQLDLLGTLSATDYQLEGEGPVVVPTGAEELRYSAVAPDGTTLRFRTVAVVGDGRGAAVTLSAPAAELDGLVAAQDAVLAQLRLARG